MKLKDFISEDKAYKKAEDEIVKWVEETYSGLTIIFERDVPEIVRIDENIDFDKEQVAKITEVVNIKIGDILEKYEEEIYIAEKLTLIWKNHPRFNPEVECVNDLKKNKTFLKYFKELKNQPRRYHG